MQIATRYSKETTKEKLGQPIQQSNDKSNDQSNDQSNGIILSQITQSSHFSSRKKANKCKPYVNQNAEMKAEMKITLYKQLSFLKKRRLALIVK